MGSSTCIGRIGALAVALGIGSAVVAWPGVAVAGPVGESDSSSAPAGETGPDARGAGGDTKTPVESDDPGGLGIFRHNPLKKILTGLASASASAQATRGAVVHVNGDATATRKRKDPEASSSEPDKSVAGSASADGDGAPAVTRQVDAPVPKVLRTFAQPNSVTAAVSTENARTSSAAVPASVDQVAAAVPHVPDVVAAPARLGLHIVTGVLAAALAPFASPSAPGNVPPAPTLIAILAFVRREIQHELFNQRPTLVADTQTAQAAGDVVTGHVTGADPDGDALTYTASGGAPGSTVTVDNQGNWTYTAPPGAVGDTAYDDSFTITASDGDGHLHGLGGLLAPDGGHTASVNVAVSVDPESVGPPPPVFNPVTGQVTGSLGVASTNGQPLAITVVDQPKYGTVVFNETTGTYVYTPTQAGKLIAGSTPGGVTDTFTVNVAQGTPPTTFARTASFSSLAAADAGQSVTVPDIQVATATLTTTGTIPAGNAPTGPILTDDNAYVLNYNDPFAASNPGHTVTVINTATGQQVDTDPLDGNPATPLTVGTNPVAGALDNTHHRLYVVNQTDGTISVIDTQQNAVVNTIPVSGSAGNLMQPVLSPDGSKLYVTSAGQGVYVVNTASGTVIDADPNSSGTYIPLLPPNTPYDPSTGADAYSIPSIAISDDGNELYVVRAHTHLSPSPTTQTVTTEVVVVDTDPTHTATYNTEVAHGIASQDGPGAITVSGNKIYATAPDLAHATTDPATGLPIYPLANVVVIDNDPTSTTYRTVVKEIPVGRAPSRIVTSSDKSVVYVLNADSGTITAIDVVSDTVITTVTYDDTPSFYNIYDSIGVSPDGETIYVSNLASDTVTPVKVGNTVPAATLT